jgi:ribosomal protein L30E
MIFLITHDLYNKIKTGVTQMGNKNSVESVEAPVEDKSVVIQLDKNTWKDFEAEEEKVSHFIPTIMSYFPI